MKNLRNYRFQLINILSFLSIVLAGCRASNSIQIHNTTNEPIEINYCLMESIILAQKVKQLYGDNISSIPDSVIQKIKQELFGSTNFEFREIYNPKDGQNTSFINIEDDTTNGCRTFTLFPRSKVVLANSYNKNLCKKDGNICPYLGRLIIKYRKKVVYEAEKEGVRNLLNYKVEWPAHEVYYLEIKNKDIKAYSKHPELNNLLKTICTYEKP